ncbi:glycosyltransferase family 2 protein [uncultured Aquimarina sp.]|uniref:glycosyltransferase family 2 protein n=1 Tax=uncultured Aquimarina sp. TaxID=575652 RepID=UPI00262465FE|nr:glycosyltransferase family 2 protein [uncultured Aquimarina sp.]
MNSYSKISDKEAKVSIIVPSYNSKNLILRTLNSVKNQTYTNLECIIVDDHSSDQTISVVKEFIKNDTRFSVFLRKSSKKGANSCRNEGLNYSTGKFVIFLDADDTLSANCIRERSKKMLRNTKLDMGIFNTVIVRKRHMLFTRYSFNPLKGFLSGSYPWQTMSPIWRRDFLVSIKGFDENFPRLQDVELHARALLNKDFKYRYFPFTKVDSFYIIENNNESVSQNKKERQISGFILYLEKMLVLIKTKKHKQFLKKMFYLLLLEISDVTIQTNIQNKVNEIERNLCFNFFEKKRIELFKHISKRNVFRQKHLFEILFINTSRIKDYLNRLLFTLIHRFI